MPGSAISHHATQNFLSWVENISKENHGIGSSTQEVDHPFIPISKLREYFEQGYTLANTLQGLLRTDDATDWCDTIMKKYLRVFSILLSIGKGPFIRNFFQKESLCDTKLPFESRPPAFPIDPSDEGFFAKFCDKQWMFCVPELEYGMDTDFVNQRILPIIKKESLSGGGNAETSLITVHDAYNFLCPTSYANQTCDGASTKTLVLKTYRGSEGEKYYESETAAFRKLLTLRSEHERYIIGFYGSFKHNDTFNLILEHADKGSLEEYMQTVQPPTDGEEINQVWRGLCDVLGGLMCIHSAERNGSDEIQYYQGWHQDVKPSNILVVSNGQASPYNYQFKLADLGTSHFKRTFQNQMDVSDRDTYGTRAYGAPECYRFSNFAATIPIQVRPSVDIWSLGCVYSEVAVWIARGQNGLERYRAERDRETSSIPGFRDGNCFHNGQNVLGCVEQIHKDIIGKNLRRTDHFSTDFLSKLVERTLVVAEARLSARQLLHQMDKTLTEAERKTYEDFSEHQSPHPTPHERLQTPPEFPSDWQYHPNGGNGHVPRWRSMPATGRTADGYPPLQRYPTTSKAIPSGQLSRGFPYQNGFKKTWNDEDSLAEGSLEPVHERTYGNEESLEFSGDQSKRKTGQLDHGEPPTPFTTSSPSRKATFPLRPKSVTGIPQKAQIKDSSIKQKLSSTMSKPKLSVAEAMSQKTDSKGNSLGSARLRDHPLLNELNERDQIFLIDDSASMQKHWNEAMSLLSVLAWMAKDADPDGIELCFTCSTSKYKNRHSGPLKDAMKLEGIRPNSFTDIRLQLGRILQQYQQRLQEDSERSSRLWTFRSTRKRARKLNIYILTNGLWQPNDPNNLIKDLVEKLQDLHLPEDQVGLQFISFGDDPNGLDRLQALDKLNKTMKLPWDVVDTERSNGNVWKMLLGATNKWFDDDDDDEPEGSGG